MKHLKKFNEDNIINNIKELTDSCLISLKDDGYEISYDYSLISQNKVCISIPDSKYQGSDKFFYYTDVKDYFIPYITLLSDDYNIKDIGIIPADSGRMTYIQPIDVINDKIMDIRISSIRVRVFNKK